MKRYEGIVEWLSRFYRVGEACVIGDDDLVKTGSENSEDAVARGDRLRRPGTPDFGQIGLHCRPEPQPTYWLRGGFFDGTSETNGLEIVLFISKCNQRGVGVGPYRMPDSFRPTQISEVVDALRMTLGLPVHQGVSRAKSAILVPDGVVEGVLSTGAANSDVGTDLGRSHTCSYAGKYRQERVISNIY